MARIIPIIKTGSSSSEILKLLKINSLKVEQKQAAVGVLNTDT